MDEVIAAWTGEWVLMQVTAFDEAQWPSHGRIVAHSPSRDAISEALAKEPPRAQQPHEGPYYIFRADPRERSGPEFEAAMAKLVADIRAVQTNSRARPSL